MITHNYVNSLIRDRIVLDIRDTTTQQILSREHALTLKKIIDICKSVENAMLKGNMYRAETVNRGKIPRMKEKAKSVKRIPEISCKYCGKRHVKSRQQCPA